MMNINLFISVLVTARFSLAAPNPLPVAVPDPSPVAAPDPTAAPDPQGWWGDIVNGVQSGISAGIATGVQAGFENPWDIPGAIATGVATGWQTGVAQTVGNLVGTADPGYCENCPQVRCSGINACQCQNVATLSCWVSSGFRCRRPSVGTCSGQSPTGNSAQYASCGRGLPNCPSGTTCDRSLTVGCVDFTNSGNCIGVCLPTYAPYSPAQNPSYPVSIPYQPQPTILAPARGQCRGPGYDGDCAGDNAVCIADPAAPYGANTPGVCANPTASCGGTAMRACSAGRICVDDPRDSCPPGSVGCLGICV